MDKSYNAITHEIRTPQCIDCFHYVVEYSATPICGNDRSSTFLEEVQPNDSCDNFEDVEA